MEFNKEQKIIGTWNSRFRPDNNNLCDWHKGINILVNNELNIKDLISHTTNLEESPHLIEKINMRRQDKLELPNFNKAIVFIE